MDKQASRERTVVWEDPLIAAQQALRLPGLQFLQGIVSGDIPAPPVGLLIRMRLVEAAEGRAVFRLEPDESLYNPIGSVHGGILATACDSAASCAVQTHLRADQAYTTLEMKINYIRRVTAETGPLHCAGQAIHVGRRIGTAEARLMDDAGTLYAHAVVTCLIFQTG